MAIGTGNLNDQVTHIFSQLMFVDRVVGDQYLAYPGYRSNLARNPIDCAACDKHIDVTTNRLSRC
jgi:hypothetical protein